MGFIMRLLCGTEGQKFCLDSNQFISEKKDEIFKYSSDILHPWHLDGHKGPSFYYISYKSANYKPEAGLGTVIQPIP